MASILGNLLGGAISTAAAVAAGVAQSQKKASSGAAFSGSAGQVGVYDRQQQAIRDRMNANSQAWHTAGSQAEKDRLHAENVALAAQLGGSVQYDGSTGYWSGSAAAPELPAAAAPAYTPTDYRAYLQEMAAAQLERQQAALEQAYAENLSGLQAEQSRLGASYQSARSAAAADSSLARQRWNETAAAYGLNSGTNGQAQLSFANRLQGDLSALHAAESAANAEIERQRTNLGQAYRSALVQAQAENNYQLFQQLYSEAVRLDQALQEQSQFNAGMALQQYQTALDRYYADLDYRADARAQQRADQLAAAQLAAGAGDYSLYGQYYGWDDGRVNQLNAQWQAANGTSTGTSSGGTTGGRGGSGSAAAVSGGSGAASDPIEAAYAAGCRTYAAAVAYFKALGYGDGLSQELAGRLERQVSRGELGVDEGKVRQLYNNIVEMRRTAAERNDPDFVRKAVEAYAGQEQLQLTRQEQQRLLEMFGYRD